jgi:hypothetical protein
MIERLSDLAVSLHGCERRGKDLEQFLTFFHQRLDQILFG